MSQSVQVDNRLINNQPVTNVDTATIFPGMPVRIVGPSTVRRSSADVGGLSAVDGLAFGDPADPAEQLSFRTQGRMTLKPEQWDQITGELGGLFPGAIYYLGLDPGMLTSAAPFQPGQSVCTIGTALTPSVLIIRIRAPLLL